MVLYGDYHTHTKESDGKGTIEDNVKSAIAKGLKEIGITNHGFKHMAHGINTKKFLRMYDEVQVLKQKYEGKIKILYGIEANLIDANGKIDFPKKYESMIDYIVVGYHKLFWTSISAFFNFLIPNTFRIGKASQKRIDKNTNAYIKAMEKYNIAILAHLKYANCTVDVKRIAKVAEEKNVLIELNGKRIDFTNEEIADVLNTKANFVVSSDAHICTNVGRSDYAITTIVRNRIPLERVANMDKCPSLNSYKQNI